MAFTRKWYSADLHLGHAGILNFGLPTRSSFTSTEEMDKVIIEKINERVAPTDLFYILGDFAHTSDVEYVRHCFHAMNGRKVLIVGNHDLDKKGRLAKVVRDLPWDIPPTPAMETHDNDKRIHLSHYAHRVWPASHHGSYHFYGHSHAALPGIGRSRDVGIDMPDVGFGPMLFTDLIKGME